MYSNGWTCWYELRVVTVMRPVDLFTLSDHVPDFTPRILLNNSGVNSKIHLLSLGLEGTSMGPTVCIPSRGESIRNYAP